MTKATKPAMQTVMSIRLDRLETIMSVLVRKPEMREAVLLRHHDYLTIEVAARRCGVSRMGLHKTENKIVEIDKMMESVYAA